MSILEGTEVTYRRQGAREFTGIVVGKAGTHRDLYLVRKWDDSIVACDVDHLWEEVGQVDTREEFGTCY